MSRGPTGGQSGYITPPPDKIKNGLFNRAGRRPISCHNIYISHANSEPPTCSMGGGGITNHYLCLRSQGAMSENTGYIT